MGRGNSLLCLLLLLLKFELSGHLRQLGWNHGRAGDRGCNPLEPISQRLDRRCVEGADWTLILVFSWYRGRI